MSKVVWVLAIIVMLGWLAAIPLQVAHVYPVARDTQRIYVTCDEYQDPQLIADCLGRVLEGIERRELTEGYTWFMHNDNTDLRVTYAAIVSARERAIELTTIEPDNIAFQRGLADLRHYLKETHLAMPHNAVAMRFWNTWWLAFGWLAVIVAWILVDATSY